MSNPIDRVVIERNPNRNAEGVIVTSDVNAVRPRSAEGVIAPAIKKTAPQR